MFGQPENHHGLPKRIGKDPKSTFSSAYPPKVGSSERCLLSTKGRDVCTFQAFVKYYKIKRQTMYFREETHFSHGRSHQNSDQGSILQKISQNKSYLDNKHATIDAMSRESKLCETCLKHASTCLKARRRI